MANNIHNTGDTCFRFRATVGTGGVTKGHMVKISSNTIVAATDGAGIAGVALGTYADGAIGVFAYGPIVVKMTAASGVNFGHLDTCYVATSSTIDAGAQGNTSCGRVVYDDPATAGTVYMLLHTAGLTDTVTHA
jgi:hypothetical protein